MTRHTETTHGIAGRAGNGAAQSDDYRFWREHTAITLQPVAAPPILGLFGFAVSTFMVAANLAGWYGNATTTPLVLFPLTFAFGGVAQLLAATTRRVVLPVGHRGQVAANRPGASASRPIEYPAGYPGAKVGQ
jgi:hypothetical protein